MRGRPRRPVGRARLGRGAARRHPPRRAGADGARAQPVPRLGRDVGRVGRLRPGRRRLLRDREARGRRRRARRARRRSASPRTASCCTATRIAAGLQETFASSTATMESLCYRDRLHVDRGRLAGGARQPHRRRGHRLRARTTARTSGSGTPTRRTRRSTRRWSSSEPGAMMRDPNRWQPLALDQLDRPERHADPGQGAELRRAALGARRGVRPAARRPTGCRSTRARRRCSAGDDAGSSEPAVEVLRLQQLARSGRRRDDRHRSRRAAATTRSATNDGDGHDVNPATGRAVRARTWCSRGDFGAGPGRVLGRRAGVGDAAGALEHDRQRGLRLARASSAGSAARARRSTGSSGT